MLSERVTAPKKHLAISDLILPVYFRIADGWCFKRLPDGDGLVYHPFTGDLYAVSATPCVVLATMGGHTFTREELLNAVPLGGASCRTEGELVEMESHFDELTRLGVIVSVGL